MSAFTFLLVTSMSFANADELCGEGPRIEYLNENTHIKVRPIGSAYWDYTHLQTAVDKVTPGGLVELCEGEFFLGDNASNWKTVYIRKGLTIKGKKINGQLKSIVIGGGSRWARKSNVAGVSPDIHAGPFIVHSIDTNPVNFEQVWLKEWISESIIVSAANGFSFTHSKITHPKTGGWGYPVGLTHFVHAILIFNKKSTGTLTVTDNDVDLTWYTGKKFHDVQFVTLFGSPSTTFSEINLSRNNIITPDEAFELTANNSATPSNITIADNNIHAHLDVKGNWPYHYPIFVAGNKNTASVRIENNTLNLSNHPRMSKDKNIGAFVLTGNNFIVKNNTVNFDNFTGNIFDIGNLGNIVVVDFGISMNNGEFSGNTFTGKANGSGIRFFGGRRNTSTNNTFHLGDMIKHTTAKLLINAKKSNACGNTFIGETGGVLGTPDQDCK